MRSPAGLDPPTHPSQATDLVKQSHLALHTRPSHVVEKRHRSHIHTQSSTNRIIKGERHMNASQRPQTFSAHRFIQYHSNQAYVGLNKAPWNSEREPHLVRSVREGGTPRFVAIGLQDVNDLGLLPTHISLTARRKSSYIHQI